MPCVLLVIHAPYELAFDMFSFMFVSSYCWLPCDAMKCFVVSGMSLQSYYHESVFAKLSFSSKSETDHITCHVCMGATSFSVHLWLNSLREFCSLPLLLACHAFFAMICSYSMLFASSKHCYLILFIPCLVFSPSL